MSYQPPRQRKRSGMSTARILRKAKAKAERKHAVQYTKCAICDRLIAAENRALLQARLEDHYIERHPYVYRDGGRPVLAQSQPYPPTQRKDVSDAAPAQQPEVPAEVPSRASARRPTGGPATGTPGLFARLAAFVTGRR